MRKKFSAKIGSLVLSLCMVATLFSGVTPVFADTTANQIGSYYETYKIDNEGQIDTTNNAASSSSSQTIENGLVTMEKTIRPTGTENVFDVTLKVTTQEDLQTFDRSPDAAVVFVMDTSNSMKWDMEGNEKNIAEKDQRITKAKAAANKFLESYIKDADGAKRLISIVEFGSNAQTVAGWTNINSAAALEEMKNVITNDISVGFQFEEEQSFWVEGYCTKWGCDKTEKHKHKDDGYRYWVDFPHCTACNDTDPTHTHKVEVSDNGGTNIEAGLMLAKNLLGDARLETITNLYVIMLTDGVPTYHVEGTSDSTSLILGERGGGSEAEYDDYKDVPGLAEIITASSEENGKGAELFSIFYGKNNGKKVGDYDNASDWLDTFVSRNYDAENSNQLEIVLEKISITIKNMAEAWKVTDPMGDYMLFDKEYNRDNNAIYPDNTGAASRIYNTKDATLYWNLRKESGEPKDMGNGVTEYAYTLTYRVKLDTLSAGFEAEAFYPTNKETTLDYMLTREDVKYELKTANFKTPTVMGFVEDLLQFKKVGPDNNKGLAGAEFALIDENGNEIAKTTSGTGQGQGNDIGNVRFSNIPSGHTYTLRETKAPEGYETCEDYTVKVEYGKATIFDKDGNALSNSGSQMPKITNVPDSKKMDLVVTKKWIGTSGDYTSVYITLKKTVSGTTSTVAENVELKAIDKWTYTFEDLPTVDTKTGANISYQVEESVIEGYKTSGGTVTEVLDPTDKTKVIGLEATITNTIFAEKTLTIAKDWLAPESSYENVTEIEVMLKKNGNDYKTYKLTKDSEFQVTTEKLPVYDELGNRITWTVEEITELDGFNAAATGIESNGVITIVNQIAQDYVSINGSKTWVDNGNAYESRPESIEVELYKDGEATGNIQTVEPVTDPESGKPSWNFNFSNLEKYSFEEGKPVKEIVYSVKEVGETNSSVTFVEGFPYQVNYKTEGLGTNNLDILITNTLAESRDIEISKVWDSAEDTVVPTSVGVYLWQNDKNITADLTGEEKIVLNDDNGWAQKIYDLPVYDEAGVKYVYTATEDTVSGYNPSLAIEEGNGQLNLILTNTDEKLKDTITIQVLKKWIDVNTNSRPASIQYEIKADGTPIEGSPFTMTAEETENWTKYQEHEVPKYDADGNIIDYTVEEIDTDSNYNSNGAMSAAEGNAYLVTLTNTIKQVTIDSINGTKVWVDGDNALNKRPESITAVLKADGEGIEQIELKTAELSGNEWEIVFDNDGKGYDKYKFLDDNGNITVKEIEYTIDELAVPEGYSKTVSGNTITNSLKNEEIPYTVTKTWIDGSNAQGKRPESVTFTIDQMVNETVVDTISHEMTENDPSVTTNQWSYTFYLPKYSDDLTKEYTYGNLEESNTGSDYEIASADDHNISNRLIVKEITVHVTKQWIGPVPEDITLEMVIFRTTDPSAEQSDWEEVETLTLPVIENGNVSWTVSAEGLAIYDDAYNKYTYMVVEKNNPAGYESNTTKPMENNFVVTNTVVQETITISGEKHWNNIPDGGSYLPETITVQLFAGSGDEPIAEVETSAAQEWKYSFSELPQYAYGDGTASQIRYTVREKGVENGTISFGQKDENGYEIRFQSSNNGYDLNNEYINPETYSYRVTSSYTTITDDVRGTTEWVVDKDATYLHKDENGNKPEADINAKDYENYQDNTYTLVSASIDDVKVVVPEKENIEDHLKFILEKAGHEYKVVLNFEREVKTPPTPPIIVETDHKVIVNYLEEGTETVLSSPSAQVVEHSQWYDVTDLTELVINGYDRVSVSGGKVSGYAYGNVVINVYYKQADITEKYHSITVNYLDEASGESIADSYVTTAKEGDSYDVTSQDQIAIEGYDYVRTEGDALTGTATKDMVINVYYSELTDIDDGDVPLDDDPFDEDGDETVDIEDGDVPKAEDPNVPNTGDETNKGLWFSLFGISAISLAVLLFGKKRKTEEE